MRRGGVLGGEKKLPERGKGSGEAKRGGKKEMNEREEKEW